MAITVNPKIVISAVDKFSGTFGSFSKKTKLLAVGALAAEVGIAALSIKLAEFSTTLAQSAIVAAADFRDAIFDISAVTGPAGASISQIGTVLDETVAKFPVTGKEAGIALESIAQFGFSSAESLKSVSDAALTLKIATGSELQTAVSGLTATLQQFGIESSEVDRVSNLFAKTQFTSAASVGDLREALKTAGPTAAVFGQGLEETVAVLAQLRNQGLEASQTGTVLRQSLAQLAKETDKGATALAKYGLTYDDVNPSTKSYVEILKAFQGQTVSAADAVNIFGVRQLAFVDLINKGADGVANYTKEITGTDAAVLAAATKSEKFSVVIDNLGGTFDVFKKTIGENFLPVLIDVIGKDENSGIRGVVGQLQKLEKEQGAIGQPLIDAFNSIKDAVNEVFKGSFEGDIKNVYSLLSKLSDFLGTNIEIITNFGKSFLATFIDATNNTDALANALKIINGAFTALGIAVALVYDAVTSVIDTAILGFGTWNKVIETIIGVFKNIAEIANKTGLINLTTEIQELDKWSRVFGQTADESFNKVENKSKSLTKTIIEGSTKNTEAINKFSNAAKKSLAEIGKQETKIDVNTEPIEQKLKDLQATLDGANDFEVVGDFVNKEEIKDEINKINTFLNEIKEKKISIDINTKKFAEDSNKIIEEYEKIKTEIDQIVLQIPFETEEARQEFKTLLLESKETRDEFVKQWKDGEQKRISDLADSEQKRIEEIKKGAKEQLTIIEDSLKERETLFVESSQKIDEQRAKGLITEEDAIKESLKLEENFYKDKIDLAEENLEQTRIINDESVASEEDALDQLRQARIDFTDFKIQKIEQEAQLARDALQKETNIRKAELDTQLANIGTAEAQGVITTKEAVTQKIKAEREWAEEKVRLATEAVEQASKQYGVDSEEYATAVSQKAQADEEYTQKNNELTQQEIKNQDKSLENFEKNWAERWGKNIEEENRKKEAHEAELKRMSGSKKKMAETGAELDKLIQGAQDYRNVFHVPVTIFLETDSAKQSLEDLQKIQAENIRGIGEAQIFNAALADAYEERLGRAARENQKLQEEYIKVGKSAAEAGLEISVFGKTLDELQADAEERIEGWNNFKEALAGVGEQTLQLSDEYANLGQTVDESALGAAENFQSVVDETKNLTQQIKEINKEFGTGNIEAAEEMADGVIDAYENIYDQAVDVLDDLKDEWETLGDKIEEINGKIVDIETSTQEAIRNARREGFTELELYQDMRLEFSQVYGEAEQAVAQGNFDLAVELFEKAADIAEDLQGEIKDENGEVIKSFEETTATSIDLMQQASDAAILALNQQSTSLVGQQNQISNQIDQTVNSLSGLSGQMQNVTKDTEQAAVQMSKFIGLVPPNIDTLVNFQGSGSSVRPLSEKIDEMTGKVQDFSKDIEDQKPKYNADFAGLRKGLDSTLEAGGGGGAAFSRPPDDSNVLRVDFPGIGDIQKQTQDTNKIFDKLTDGDQLKIPAIVVDVAGGGGFGGGINIEEITQLINNSFGTGIDKLIEVFNRLTPVSEVGLNVQVQSNSQPWLDGLVQSIIDQIFVRARAENFVVFGRES